MPSFRGFPCSAELAEWLPWYEKVLLKRGVIHTKIDVYQLQGDAPQSAGYHKDGYAYDIEQRDPVSLEVANQMGAFSWERTEAQGFDPHQHGGLYGITHENSGLVFQAQDRKDGWNGLVGKHRARDTRPVSGRDWRQGIEWAKKELGAKPSKPEVLGVDYSFARPGGAVIKAAGYTCVGRYLSNSPSKNISSGEAKMLQAAQLGIFLVWETTASRAKAGRDAGVTDAKEALYQANTLGVPVQCPLFFAVDFDGSWAQVAEYLAGAQSVVGRRAGVYGSHKITTDARAHGIDYTWQTMAWSAGLVDKDANILQRLRPTVAHPIQDTDENLIQHPFPMWTTTVTGGSTVPTTPSSTKLVHLSDSRITESSWLALSQKFPGLAYTGNDENGLLFTIDLATGNTVGTFKVNWSLVDPESADVHNGALWLSDLGDNAGTRNSFNLYVLAEPGKGNKATVAANRYRVRYSDGPRNAEAFFIHPVTGHRYIISKEASGGLYRNDVGTLDVNTVGLFRRVGSKLPAYVTEAKFTPDGRFVLCRQKDQPKTVTVLDGDTFKTLERIPVTAVKQPESLDTDGTYVWLGSEGSNSPLVREELPPKYQPIKE